MIEIAFSSSFKRAFKKNVAGNANLETIFWERVELFRNNPFEPKLSTERDKYGAGLRLIEKRSLGKVQSE